MNRPFRRSHWLSAVALFTAACSEPPPPLDLPPQVLTVLTSAPAAGSERVLTGSIAARHELPLGFRTAGRVLRRSAEVGQSVPAGAVLGELDPADYALNLRLAEDQQRAAEVDFAQAQRDAERFGRLGAQGALGTAEEERQRARATAAAARLDQSRHQVELAQRRVDYSQLRAPFAGVITQVQFEAGLSVSEGQPVLTLADPREREVVADIPLELQGALASLHVLARLPEGGEALPLQLRELAPQANPLARTVRVRFRAASARGLPPHFGLGRAVDLQLRSAASATVPGSVVPVGAVLEDGKGAAVFRVDAATLQLVRVPVRVLGYAPDTVRVEGLEPGLRIVAAGVHKLHEGMKVGILTRSASGIDLVPPATVATHP